MGDLTLTPGAWVRHPDKPEWGLGRVQSSINGKVTVNFEEAGKVTVDVRYIQLQLVRHADDNR